MDYRATAVCLLVGALLCATCPGATGDQYALDDPKIVHLFTGSFSGGYRFGGLSHSPNRNTAGIFAGQAIAIVRVHPSSSQSLENRYVAYKTGAEPYIFGDLCWPLPFFTLDHQGTELLVTGARDDCNSASYHVAALDAAGSTVVGILSNGDRLPANHKSCARLLGPFKTSSSEAQFLCAYGTYQWESCVLDTSGTNLEIRCNDILDPCASLIDCGVKSSPGPVPLASRSEIFFSAFAVGSTYPAPFVSDSTTLTAIQVSDIEIVGNNMDVTTFNNNEYVVFTANDGSGPKPWRSNGTPLGTSVLDQNIESSEIIFGAAPNGVMIATPNKLYYNDGTTSVEVKQWDVNSQNLQSIREAEHFQWLFDQGTIITWSGRFDLSLGNDPYGNALYVWEPSAQSTTALRFDLNEHAGQSDSEPSHTHAIRMREVKEDDDRRIGFFVANAGPDERNEVHMLERNAAGVHITRVNEANGGLVVKKANGNEMQQAGRLGHEEVFFVNFAGCDNDGAIAVIRVASTDCASKEDCAGLDGPCVADYDCDLNGFCQRTLLAEGATCTPDHLCVEPGTTSTCTLSGHCAYRICEREDLLSWCAV